MFALIKIMGMENLLDWLDNSDSDSPLTLYSLGDVAAIYCEAI